MNDETPAPTDPDLSKCVGLAQLTYQFAVNRNATVLHASTRGYEPTTMEGQANVDVRQHLW